MKVDNLTLERIFQSKRYLIPDFQREYTWQIHNTKGKSKSNKCVRELFDDIINAYDTERDEQYHFGTYIVYGKGINNDGCSNDVCGLTDGRQRLTTLFCMLCAIKRIMREKEQKTGEDYSEEIKSVSTNLYKPITEKGRVVRKETVIITKSEQYNKLLERMAKSEKMTASSDEMTETEFNTVVAYNALYDWLNKWDADGGDIFELSYFITKNLALVEMMTDSKKKAQNLFETVNGRGVNLSQVEMLKNKLFETPDENEDDNEELSEKWNEFYNYIEKQRWSMDKFLVYYMYAKYRTSEDTSHIEEKEIYQWVENNKVKIGYATNPIAFVDRMYKDAQILSEMLMGNYHGKYNDALYKIRRMGNDKVSVISRHYLVFLTITDMHPEAFQYFIQKFDIYMFHHYCVTKDDKKWFETFKKWAPELREVRTLSDAIEFVQNYIIPEDVQLIEPFRNVISKGELMIYHYTSGNNRKASHFIKRIAQLYDEKRGYPKDYKYYENFTLEHIISQTPKAYDEGGNELFELYQKGSEDYQRTINLLGNFTLLTSTENASLQNPPYSEKKDVYSKCDLYLTRSMVKKDEIGTNTKVDKFNNDICTYEKFSSEADIFDRQKKLCEISLKYIKI